MATTQRIENTQDTASHTKAHGHLSLVEWPADTAPVPVPARKPAATVRRASADRLYDGGVILLMLASTAAAVASFAHL